MAKLDPYRGSGHTASRCLVKFFELRVNLAALTAVLALCLMARCSVF